MYLSSVYDSTGTYLVYEVTTPSRNIRKIYMKINVKTILIFRDGIVCGFRRLCTFVVLWLFAVACIFPVNKTLGGGRLTLFFIASRPLTKHATSVTSLIFGLRFADYCDVDAECGPLKSYFIPVGLRMASLLSKKVRSCKLLNT